MALAFKKMKLTQFMIATVFLASIVSFSSMVNEIETMDFIGSIVNRPCNSNIQMPSQKQPIGFSRLFRKAVKYLTVVKLLVEYSEVKGRDFVNIDKETKNQPVCSEIYGARVCCSKLCR